eukprot:762036-Hanusia_phi.AAC.6
MPARSVLLCFMRAHDGILRRKGYRCNSYRDCDVRRKGGKVIARIDEKGSRASLCLARRPGRCGRRRNRMGEVGKGEVLTGKWGGKAITCSAPQLATFG